MNLIRNTYPVVLTASQMNVLHQGLLELSYQQQDLSAGIQLYTLEAYRKAVYPHLCVLSNAQKTQVIGCAYRDDQMNRVWFVQTSKTTGSLMIDGDPHVVSNLGFQLDTTTGQITTTYQQSVVLAEIHT